MKVLLVPNYARAAAVEGARELCDLLEDQGVDVVWAHDKKLFPNKVVDTRGVDLVVSLGGDGTLLRAARIVGYQEIPVVGISYGHLGFLTSGGPAELKQVVFSALAGEMHASRRATLAVEVSYLKEDGMLGVAKSFALNDLCLSHGIKGDMIEFDISVSGHHIDRLRADGFVVSTATGSTGYALSAGGPIVTPQFKGMVCVPVAPHTIMARAFLTAPSDVVEIHIDPERHAQSIFFADGQQVGEGFYALAARVTRGPGDLILLDRREQSFYESVSRVFYGKGKPDAIEQDRTTTQTINALDAFETFDEGSSC